MANKLVKGNPGIESMPDGDKSSDFMLAEYQESYSAWRITNDRIESAVKFYLSVFTAAAPVLAVLYNYLSDFKVFIAITIVVNCCLVGMGYVAIQSIHNADIHKAENLHSIHLIRKYFTDHDPKLLPYLYFPVAGSIAADNESGRRIQPKFSKILVLGINIANSILIGWVISSSIWLVLRDSFVQSIIIGFAVALFCFVIFQLVYRRRIKKFLNAQQAVH